MARIEVSVTTRAKKQALSYNAEKKQYFAKLRSPPENNKANIELLNLISRELGGRARLLTGHNSKNKVIEIQD
ncbi:DUF167 domain-containing protein [Candidatus Woesearchaeota archaeon]|nr:DUF167 domain-containing protein [Candidatus Woesearchaeota archaeon]